MGAVSRQRMLPMLRFRLGQSSNPGEGGPSFPSGMAARVAPRVRPILHSSPIECDAPRLPGPQYAWVATSRIASANRDSAVRLSDTLIFAPTLNEVANIDKLLDGLLSLPDRCDVLIIDDGSVDGTLDVLAKRTTAEPRLHAIFRLRKLGIGSAHKLAWKFARQHGYSRIVSLDADLSHDPAEVPLLLAALEGGADVALGSRFVAGGQLDYRGWRRFVSRAANSTARRLLGLPIAEYTTSLRAARLERVPRGLVESIDQEGYGFFLTCVVRLSRAGLKLAEVPIHFRDRAAGASKISSAEIGRAALNLLRLAFQRRNPPF
jgi:dolichol-phosphate mannosyltransferase